jgi:UDP-N-acetyl-D-mannosaminuronic acid dehydrogenase
LRICVLGLGYIGLPTALLLSRSFDVCGCDINKDVVGKINNKILPFVEPGLDDLLRESGIKAEIHPVESDAFVICVPTPFDKELKMADLGFVINAAKSIIPYLRKGNLIIIESTITPGTCEKVIVPIIEKSGLRVGVDIFLSHCPERAIPGKTLIEMVNNNRVIGGIDGLSSDKAEEIYRSFVKGEIFKTNIRTAEFVKLMENTYRDVNIALANEFAILSEEVGIDAWEAIELANKHPRVSILSPGPGVGGHCIAIDPWFLTESTINARIISTAREINDEMPAYVISKIKDIIYEENITNPVIAILGVAYKGNIDDTRETPALKLIKLCERKGWDIRIHDPHVKKFEYQLMSLDLAIKGADLIVIETDHEEFCALDAGFMSHLVRHKLILDLRNILSIEAFVKEGFTVRKLGGI